MSLQRNQVFAYLTHPLFAKNKTLANILSNKGDFKILGYYIGHYEVDPENVVYIQVDVLNRLALEKLEIIPAIKKIYDVGGLFSTKVMLVVKLDEEYKNTRKKFLLSKYSEMFTREQLRKIRISGFGTEKFMKVVSKAPSLRREKEELYNCTIPEEVELDEIIHLDREVLDYGKTVDYRDNVLEPSGRNAG